MNSAGSGGVCLEDELIEPQARQFGKAQILVAEDDAIVAQELKCRLESLDYEVVGITQYAEQAVTLAEKLRPDLVLMDIQLRGEMDGIQAGEQIRKLRVPLIYVSGYCDGPVLERAQRTEPYGYILKPYRTADLRISVEMSLQRFRAEQERVRLLQRFREVLASVKTLTGQLAICCYCKKVRDEAGNWPDIETYLMQHSDASFTHGMCPECFTRLQERIQAIEQTGVAAGAVVLG
ncbi:MAG TPA: response regulator [Candidatus Limnocylindrales bacterium]|jgi:CheY-like chemotaxis protein|nr:response regulator [Candidatus Limnocylindrales bacterium]